MIPNNLTEKLLESAFEEKLIGILFIDVDHTQKINEICGHEACDEFLCSLPNRINKNLSGIHSSNTQVGGDKYLSILKGADVEKTFEIAHKIQMDIQNTVVRYNHYSVNVTVSVGAIIMNNRPGDSTFGKAVWLKELVEASCSYAKFSGGDKVITIDLR